MKYLNLKRAIQYVMGLSAPVNFYFSADSKAGGKDTELLFTVLDNIITLASKRGGIKGVLVEDRDFFVPPDDEVVIPKLFWKHNTIDEVALFEGGSRTRSKWFTGGSSLYTDLRFSKWLLFRVKWGMKISKLKRTFDDLSYDKIVDILKSKSANRDIVRKTEVRKDEKSDSAEFIKNIDEINKRSKEGRPDVSKVFDEMFEEMKGKADDKPLS